MRLDIYIVEHHKLSRSMVQKLIKAGNVMVNDVVCLKNAFEVDEEDVVQVEIPPVQKLEIKPEDLKIDILYEDEHLAVVYKPAGMVTHPSVGHHSGTLVNGLMFKLKNLSGIGGVERPGIVHRLDKDTEGLLLIAKNDKAHQALSDMIAERTVTRRYLAWAKGQMNMESKTVDTFYGRHLRDRQRMAVLQSGKKAVTHFYPQMTKNSMTLVECKLQTGRTHQIRVHLAHMGHPVVGDGVYGTPSSNKTQMLCAYLLKFEHPVTGQELEFKIKPSFLSDAEFAQIKIEGQLK